MPAYDYTHWYSRLLLNGVPYDAMVDTIGRVQNWSQWCGEWTRTAEQFEQAGDAALEAGHELSARDHYLVAAACYHYAEFLFVEDLPLKTATLRRCVDVFGKALPYIGSHIERVEIPFAGTTLPGYFWAAGGGRRPCVIQIQGLDSIKEVESYYVGKALAERGTSTLMFDGPGQSEAWERVKMDVHYEEAVSAVVDYLLTRQDVDSGAIGVFGASLGGYLAPRAAASDTRIKAAGGNSGPFDMHAWVARTAAQRQERVRIAWGADSVEALLEDMKEASLAALPGPQCPLLVLHGERDAVVPAEEGRRIYDWACGERQLAIFDGGDHVCTNRPVESVSLIADWFADHLPMTVSRARRTPALRLV